MSNRRAFTLLEVVIALAILSVGLMVLVDTQASSVMLSVETARIRAATFLAQEKMSEVLVELEVEGWGEQDIEDQGVFEDFGSEEFRGDGIPVDVSEEFADYKWAYTVRAIELTLPTDMGSTAEDLEAANYWGTAENENQMETTSGPGLEEMGVSTDMITEMLANYIREVRVLVWWGDNADELDQVELVTHIINPSGEIVAQDGSS